MANYNYPNDRMNPAGAIPVYIVAQPTGGFNPSPPNAQNNAQGAIPVNIVAAPTVPYAGAIPVRVVAAPGIGPTWPSDQGQDAGAIPVWSSTDPKAIPVWRIN
jgi:hypothetical protein